VVVHLGRDAAMGGARRVAGLRAVLEAGGCDVAELGLRREVPATARSVLGADLWTVLRGAAVPETLAWSVPGAIAALERRSPDLVICSTARTFHPAMAQRWPVLVDFIDQLSVSYRDRAAVHHGARRWGLRLLARRMGRFERTGAGDAVGRLAAGWGDAAMLGATWVPITVPPVEPVAEWAGGAPTFDAVFVGNLSYEPNVEAVLRLRTVWPLVQREHPGARLLVAGAHPTAAVRRAAAEHGWSLQPDFDDLATVLASARVAIAPLAHASGIQTKVLEAAAHGLPQVVSPAAFAGLDPEFPVDVAGSDVEFAGRVAALLGAPSWRADLGRRGRAHVTGLYGRDHWVPWVASLLGRAERG
jgi:hypothetical protein